MAAIVASEPEIGEAHQFSGGHQVHQAPSELLLVDRLGPVDDTHIERLLDRRAHAGMVVSQDDGRRSR